MISNNNKYTTSVYDRLTLPSRIETNCVIIFYYKLFNPSSSISSEKYKTIKKNYKSSSPVNEKGDHLYSFETL